MNFPLPPPPPLYVSVREASRRCGREARDVLLLCALKVLDWRLSSDSQLLVAAAQLPARTLLDLFRGPNGPRRDRCDKDLDLAPDDVLLPLVEAEKDSGTRIDTLLLLAGLGRIRLSLGSDGSPFLLQRDLPRQITGHGVRARRSR